MTRPRIAALLLAGYLLTIVAANAALDRWGLIGVGFGQQAPAGVYLAAIALTLRDLIREVAGRWPVIAAIAVGAALSYLIDPALGVASGVAFLLSELLDSALYEPLRRRGFVVAATLSGLVGLVADSVIFLALADIPATTPNGSSTLTGLLLGKVMALAASVAALTPLARRRMAAA